MAATNSTAHRNDIAVVGIGCRFPGARNVHEYWNLLRDPKPQFTTVPDARWRRDSFLNRNFREQHSMYSDKMALLTDIADFDAAHYKIPPRRARFLDPQHRLLVDLSREAIQDAGWETEEFDRTNTSVIMALSESGYREISMMHIRLRQLAGGEFGRSVTDPDWAEAASAVQGLQGTALSGLLMNMGPSSISSVFDLHGESYSIDAACSGGLAAVAEAVSALRAGRCRIALAGGAQLVLTPDLLIGLCRVGAISPTGECRPFDPRANGFVLGEGAGVLVLRPLADAYAAGDRVYAVIRGVGLSNDGTVKGGMAPQRGGQLLALRRAYLDAGVHPGDVGYLEAHGTATAVGDQVEIDALRELREDVATHAYVGAAKAIIGHSLGASGIAGLIKSILMVRHGRIVPQPDVSTDGFPGLDDARLRIPDRLSEWAGDGRLAGVSAFGFGGTNVHVVLEQSPAAPSEVSGSLPSAERSELLLVSSRSRAGLARHARELAETLVSGESVPLPTMVDTLARRALFAERLAVIADSAADAAHKLIAASMSLENGTSRTSIRSEASESDACPAGRELAPSVFVGRVEPGGESVVDLSALDDKTDAARADELADLAIRAVSGSGLRLVARGSPPVTLPPSPLSPRQHWILDDAERDTTPAPPSPHDTDGPGPETVTATSEYDVGGVRTAVLEEVSRTSAFPVRDLRDNQDLVADLGFDSLMLQELSVNIRRRLPQLADAVDPESSLSIKDLMASAVPGRPSDAPPESIPEPTWDTAHVRIDEFPEVTALENRLGQFEKLGVPNPYFRGYDGVLRNTASIGDREYISFTSYNYLGLSGHPAVTEAVQDAVSRYGSSVSGSRLLAGERPVVRALERELANLLGTEDCMVLVSGHATNVTALGHIVGPEDLIVHDALAHDSILQGCALSGATRRPFNHNDLGHLEYILHRTRSRFRRVLLVVEGVYSMDGDLPHLPGLIELKNRYGTLLLVDEAHSIGTLGKQGGGIGEHFAVDRSDVDLWMGTLSKSLASCGGYLAASTRTINWLKYTLPGFVYSAGMTPPNAAAALAAIELLRSEPHRLHALRSNWKQFLDLTKRTGLTTGSAGNSPIVPYLVGDSARTLRLADRLFHRGIIVDPILHPAVEERQARLRFFLTSDHHEDELKYAVSSLAEELGELDTG